MKKLVKMDVDGNAQYTTLKKLISSRIHYVVVSMKRNVYISGERSFSKKDDVKQTWAVIKDTLQKKMHSVPSTKFILNSATTTNMDGIVRVQYIFH